MDSFGVSAVALMTALRAPGALASASRVTRDGFSNIAKGLPRSAEHFQVIPGQVTVLAGSRDPAPRSLFSVVEL